MILQKLPSSRKAFVIILLFLLSIFTIARSETRIDDMNMDSKDMNGMEMEGKDGVMSKADMKKMNIMMKDCMKIHKDKKKCNQGLINRCEKKMSKDKCIYSKEPSSK